jgi:phage tail-like protein
MALTRKDPMGGYNFAVELDGLTRAGFKSCSGLETTTTSTKYREGTDPTLAQRELTGLLGLTTIKLARGITTDRALWDWRYAVATGKTVRKNISIILRDEAGNDQIRWDLINCWPSKWSGPSFDAGSDAIAIETLEIVHEGIEVQKWG